jgi:myosin heavy subunit
MTRKKNFILLKYILDLIEARIIGCFDLLDEESKLPTPRAEHFTMEVHNRNKGHPRLDVRIDLNEFLKE